MNHPQLDKCKNGHPQTEANIYVLPKTGYRSCKICKNEGQAKRYLWNKAMEKRARERIISMKGKFIIN